MRNDIGTHYEITEGLTALSRTVAAYNGASIDHSKGASGAFVVSCGAWATSLEAKLQHSPDNSVWTDEADTSAGNDVSVSLDEEGIAQINVPNPRARYSRVVLTLGGTCVASVTNILGPLREY